MKASSTTLTYNPQQFAFCIEYFRNQLIKAQYLFSSLTLSASIGSSTLENIVVKSLSTVNLQQTSADSSFVQHNADVIEIKKYTNKFSHEAIRDVVVFFSFRDISSLEDHVHLLNQRYANEIAGWQALGDFLFFFLFFCFYGNISFFFFFFQ